MDVSSKSRVVGFQSNFGKYGNLVDKVNSGENISDVTIQSLLDDFLNPEMSYKQRGAIYTVMTTLFGTQLGPDIMSSETIQDRIRICLKEDLKMSEIEQRMNNAKNLNSVLIIKLGMSLPGESILSFLADSNSQKILMECLKSHSNVIIRSTAIKEISQATVRCSTLLQARPFFNSSTYDSGHELQRAKQFLWDFIFDFYATVLKFCDDSDDIISGSSFCALAVPVKFHPLCYTKDSEELNVLLNGCSGSARTCTDYISATEAFPHQHLGTSVLTQTLPNLQNMLKRQQSLSQTYRADALECCKFLVIAALKVGFSSKGNFIGSTLLERGKGRGLGENSVSKTPILHDINTWIHDHVIPLVSSIVRKDVEVAIFTLLSFLHTATFEHLRMRLGILLSSTALKFLPNKDPTLTFQTDHEKLLASLIITLPWIHENFICQILFDILSKIQNCSRKELRLGLLARLFYVVMVSNPTQGKPASFSIFEQIFSSEYMVSMVNNNDSTVTNLSWKHTEGMTFRDEIVVAACSVCKYVLSYAAPFGLNIPLKTTEMLFGDVEIEENINEKNFTIWINMVNLVLVTFEPCLFGKEFIPSVPIGSYMSLLELVTKILEIKRSIFGEHFSKRLSRNFALLEKEIKCQYVTVQLISMQCKCFVELAEEEIEYFKAEENVRKKLVHEIQNQLISLDDLSHIQLQLAPIRVSSFAKIQLQQILLTSLVQLSALDEGTALSALHVAESEKERASMRDRFGTEIGPMKLASFRAYEAIKVYCDEFSGKFLENSKEFHNLFKNRWHLPSPFENIYEKNSDTLDSYQSCRANIFNRLKPILSSSHYSPYIMNDFSEPSSLNGCSEPIYIVARHRLEHNTDNTSGNKALTLRITVYNTTCKAITDPVEIQLGFGNYSSPELNPVAAITLKNRLLPGATYVWDVPLSLAAMWHNFNIAVKICYLHCEADSEFEENPVRELNTNDSLLFGVKSNVEENLQHSVPFHIDGGTYCIPAERLLVASTKGYNNLCSFRNQFSKLSYRIFFSVTSLNWVTELCQDSKDMVEAMGGKISENDSFNVEDLQMTDCTDVARFNAWVTIPLNLAQLTNMLLTGWTFETLQGDSILIQLCAARKIVEKSVVEADLDSFFWTGRIEFRSDNAECIETVRAIAKHITAFVTNDVFKVSSNSESIEIPKNRGYSNSVLTNFEEKNATQSYLKLQNLKKSNELR